MTWVNFKVCLKWCVINNRSVVAQRPMCKEWVYRDWEEVLAQDVNWFISCFRVPRTVLELWTYLECDSVRSQVLPVTIQVLTTLGFPDGSSLQVWTQPVNIELSCEGRNDPTVRRVYQRPLYTEARLPNIKTPLAARASFSNATLLQRNHQNLYLCMWTGTFLIGSMFRSAGMNKHN